MNTARMHMFSVVTQLPLQRGPFTEARYHYVAPALLAALLGIAVASAIDANRRLERPVYALIALSFVAAAPWYWSRRPTLTKRDIPAMAARAKPPAPLDRLRAAVRRHAVGSTVYVENGRGFVTEKNRAAFPRLAAYFVIYSDDEWLEGRRVRFIERDPELLAAAWAGGGRVATLLVAPDQVPAP
jgi:hypothetical protein